MAIGIKSRIVYREKTKDSTANDYWAGTYSMLIRPKSIPSPVGEKNMEDTSTLEDWVATQEEGRRSAASMQVQGAWEKAKKDALVALERKPLDMLILYGTEGKGSQGVMAFIGTESIAPDEATEGHLTGTVTIAENTQPIWIEDDYDVTVVEDAQGYLVSCTLTPKSGNGGGGGD